VEVSKPGRGINLFKDFHGIFRALASAGSSGAASAGGAGNRLLPLKVFQGRCVFVRRVFKRRDGPSGFATFRHDVVQF
jgi:hypothetical protein